jgi:hypothetical protein
MKKLLKLSLLTLVGVFISTIIAIHSNEVTHAAGWTNTGSVSIQVNSTSSAKATIYLCKTAFPKLGYKIKARAVITNLYGTSGQVKAMTANAAGVSYGNVINSTVGQASVTGYGPNYVSSGSVVSGGLRSTTHAGWVDYSTATVSNIVFC